MNETTLLDDGPKAEGLRRLPSAWTPEFVALGAVVSRRLAHDNPTPALLAHRLGQTDKSEGIERLIEDATDGILVRSSAGEEGMVNRGLFQSQETGFPTKATIAEALLSVWRSAARVTGSSDPIPTVLHRLVVPSLKGHLSNERRLREDRRDWVVEVEGASNIDLPLRFNTRRLARQDLSRVDPTCRDTAQLESVLRRVAASFVTDQVRSHLEWIWDGARLWIVQIDQLRELRTRRPRASGWEREVPPLAHFRIPTSADAAFPKLRSVLEHKAAGLPFPDLRILTATEEFERLIQGEEVPRLAGDLDALSAAQAVIRTDLRKTDAPDEDFELLGARTDAAFSAKQMQWFLRQTLERLVGKGIALADICFLAHPFLPAEAAAWSLAAPGSSRVQIDSTYGLPDGLLYYPHDSHLVDIRAGIVSRALACKSKILTSDASGHWNAEDVGSPWDWRPALADDELGRMAAMSKRLADHLDHPVQTMFFVRVQAANSAIAILPWVHLDARERVEHQPASAAFFASTTVEVKGFEDIERLERLVTEAEGESRRVRVALRPQPAVLHSSEFLEALVEICAPASCDVWLEGSTLSHIYYELLRRGVSVQAQEALDTSEEPPGVEFDKLVRDAIPDAIAARGERVVTYQASGDELQALLTEKLIEESFEVAGADSETRRFEELGDMLDVLAAICELNGTTLNQVLEWAANKREQRGGFNQGVVLIETFEPSLSEAASSSRRVFPVTAETRRRVEARNSSVTNERADLSHGPLRFPFDLATEVPVRVRGEDVFVSVKPDGVHLRLAPPPPPPGQLTLEFD